MTPWLKDADCTLYHGDVLETLREHPAESVDCVVTSPPYWGLRDYGQPGQLGLEPTPEQYVEKMVEVFREVRRVLAAHGTVWLNLGDSYASSPPGNKPGTAWAASTLGEPSGGNAMSQAALERAIETRRAAQAHARDYNGLKPKDLVGIPWRVAFALQADGWYLRSDIIWSKPNPMPESVTDRPTKAHEMVFLLAKGQWKSRVVALSDLQSKIVHLGNHVGPKDANVWAHEFSVRLATAIFDCAERQEQFGLPPLDSEVWEKFPRDVGRTGVAGLPVEHRAAIYASRLLSTHGTAKEFLCEVDGLGVALSEDNQFLVLGGTARIPLPPGVNRYGDGTIAIHDSGEIGELDFSAHTLKFSRPSGCSYFFDQEAVREPAEWARWGDQTYSENGSAALYGGRIKPRTKAEIEAFRDRSAAMGRQQPGNTPDRGGVEHRPAPGGRNIRSVWEIATQPYPEAHFATFPEELARRCIAAGCPEQVCRVCGKARERIVSERRYPAELANARKAHGGIGNNLGGQRHQDWLDAHPREVLGFTDCGHADYRPGIVLDPFIGSGTVAHVARKLGRHSIGIDLNADYLALAARRLQQQSLFTEAVS